MTQTSPSDPRAIRNRMIMERWLAGRVYRKLGLTLPEWTRLCDRGQVEGLEPGAELDLLWED